MIRFNQPAIVGREFEYLTDAATIGHLSSSGPYSTRCSELLKTSLGVPDVLLTTSCTDALEMTALMMDLGPGDTVIVPSYTFTSTALAFVRASTCDSRTSNRYGSVSTRRGWRRSSTRRFVRSSCVHYGGIALRHRRTDRVLAEVAGHRPHRRQRPGTLRQHRGAPLGTFGRFSTLSFHETKNFHAVRAEHHRQRPGRHRSCPRAFDKGTNRRAFMLGEVDKYSWIDTGSSFGMSELQGAFLYAQLEEAEAVLADRGRVFSTYLELLAPHAATLGFGLPHVPSNCTNAYHLFYVMMPAGRPATPCSKVVANATSSRRSTTCHSTRPTPAGGSPIARPSARSPTTSADGSCGCRSTRTWPKPTSKPCHAPWSRS